MDKEIFSTNYLDDFVEFYCRNNNIIINDIGYENLNKGYASYDRNNGNIIFDREKLISHFNDKEIKRINLECLKILVHEMTHANQFMITSNKKESNEIIRTILNKEIELEKRPDFLEFYNKYYDYFVSEYNANMVANSFILKLGYRVDIKINDNLVSDFLKIIGDDINNYDLSTLTKKEKILYGFKRKI